MLFWKNKKRKPTSVEAIEAIFSVFTEEEMQSMMYEKLSAGTPDLGIKQLMLDYANNLKPKYSIEKIIENARKRVDECKTNLLSFRPNLFRDFIKENFKNIKNTLPREGVVDVIMDELIEYMGEDLNSHHLKIECIRKTLMKRTSHLDPFFDDLDVFKAAIQEKLENIKLMNLSIKWWHLADVMMCFFISIKEKSLKRRFKAWFDEWSVVFRIALPILAIITSIVCAFL